MNPKNEKTTPINTAFSTYQNTKNLSGRVAEIVRILAEDSIQNLKLRALIPPEEEKEYSAMQSDLIDLMLFYIKSCIKDHYLTSDECTDAIYLKMIFRINEEDMYFYKLEEIEQLLSGQISKILSDQRVNPSEALQQVELQRCFGLSYDQFLQITRPHVDRIINKLLQQITMDSTVTKSEREMLTQQILDLNTVYSLNSDQSRLLGKLK